MCDDNTGEEVAQRPSLAFLSPCCEQRPAGLVVRHRLRRNRVIFLLLGCEVLLGIVKKENLRLLNSGLTS